jgi:hypothetical protein
MNIIQDLKKSLFVCGKSGYANGEKKKFSGLMHHWMLDEDGKWLLFWKQYKLFDYNYIQEDKKYTLSKHKQRMWLLDNGYYYYPVWAYGCAFMGCRISQWKDHYYLSWYSGDDDVCIDLNFPEKDLNQVKKFILDNHRKDTFLGDLDEFVFSNKYF